MPKQLKEGGIKKVKDSMKLEEGGVHHKRYKGHCMNNELEFKGYLNITHSREKIHMANIF